jgi:hypothetical protein
MKLMKLAARVVAQERQQRDQIFGRRVKRQFAIG